MITPSFPCPMLSWEPNYRKWSRLINFFFRPLSSPLSRLFLVSFFLRFPKRGTSVKITHLVTKSPMGENVFGPGRFRFREIPKGKTDLASDRFRDTTRMKCFGPRQFRETPEGEKCFWPARTRTTTTPPTVRRTKKNGNICCVGTCFSSRFYPPI